MSDPYAEISLGEDPAARLAAQRRRERLLGDVLTGLVVLCVVVVGLPQVWQRAESGGFGVEMVFYPVLGAAFGYLAVLRRRPR